MYVCVRCYADTTIQPSPPQSCLLRPTSSMSCVDIDEVAMMIC